MDSLQVRPLKAKDVKTLAHILGKLKPSSITDIVMLVEGKRDNIMELGLSLFRVIAADLTDDIYTWLADLIGKTPVELDEMPISTPSIIIKKLVKRGDFRDFFGLATRRIKKESASSTTLSNPDTIG